MELTSRERIMRIFENKEIDRPALKLWGARPSADMLHPSYRPVHELACTKSDLFAVARSPFNVYYGQNSEKYIEKYYEDTDSSLWKDEHIIFHTPKGDLHGINRVSTVGEPSYTIEHLIKEPEDIGKMLSVEYVPFKFNSADYTEKQNELGDRGIVMFDLDHAAYAVQRLIGSENLAYFSIDCRKELAELTRVFSSRIINHAKEAIISGINGVFSWVGPELFIPPLMSPVDFDEFVFENDKKLCDVIHNGGGYVWVHCHGKVSNFIEKFVRMGVNVLNPLEPPKNGDINLEEVISKHSNCIGWEGNIEIQDIIESDPEHLKELIHTCVEAGNKSGRFILCPSAGYMEYPFPSEKYINNLMVYLNYGYECVENCRK